MSLTLKDTFRQEVTKADADINILYANLLAAEYITNVETVEQTIAQLSQLVETIRPTIQAAATEQDKLERLHHYLFDELGFRGNQTDYYQAHNSFLNQVLASRQGIPISLSAIYLEFGWQLGLPVYGVGIPNHFIVGYGFPDVFAYVDVFNQGQILNEFDLLDLAQLPHSDLEPFKQDYLKPAPRKRILHRMLLNLKHIYVQNKNWENGYKVVDLILAIHPNVASEIRDRGLIAYRLNRLSDAIYDIRNYLVLNPEARDADWLKQHLQSIERRLADLN